MGDDSAQSKLFGRYQEVAILVIGFVLTSVVGGFLGAWFQARSWSHEHSVQQCESEKETATKGAVALSDLMDKRLLRMRELAWKLQSARTLAEVVQERKANSDARDEWSTQINRNLTFTETHFGLEAKRKLQGDISNGFSAVYDQFNKMMKTGKPDAQMAHDIEDQIDSFNPTIYWFDLTLSEAISKGSLPNCLTDGNKP